RLTRTGPLVLSCAEAWRRVERYRRNRARGVDVLSLWGKPSVVLVSGTINGRTCWRRVTILYDAGYYFLCRHCYNLAYEIQSEDLLDRRMRKARKLRERLGVSEKLHEPIVWKPPRMHWKTFSRLALQVRAIEDGPNGQSVTELFLGKLGAL